MFFSMFSHFFVSKKIKISFLCNVVFLPFSKDTDTLEIFTQATKEVDYTFSLYPIPFGDKLQIKIKTPGNTSRS